MGRLVSHAGPQTALGLQLNEGLSANRDKSAAFPMANRSHADPERVRDLGGRPEVSKQLRVGHCGGILRL